MQAGSRPFQSTQRSLQGPHSSLPHAAAGHSLPSKLPAAQAMRKLGRSWLAQPVRLSGLNVASAAQSGRRAPRARCAR